jgi:hypothetical protein
MPDAGKEEEEVITVCTTYQQFRDRFYKGATENLQKKESDSVKLASFGKQLAKEVLERT